MNNKNLLIFVNKIIVKFKLFFIKHIKAIIHIALLLI
jgi:hypothetical protein